MKLGTKSLLYGAHCFFIHPWFVLIAWIKLYGFPFDPRIWIAIFVHDFGYWGKPDMDGPRGKTHPLLGAHIMHTLFDRPKIKISFSYNISQHALYLHQGWIYSTTNFKFRLFNTPFAIFIKPSKKWYNFTLYHSRFYAKTHQVLPSRLCIADKLSIAYEPWWFYLIRAEATGEIKEFMHDYLKRNPEIYILNTSQWLNKVKLDMYKYAFENKYLTQ